MVSESVENGFARSTVVDSTATVVVPVPPPAPPSTKSPPTITGADEQSRILTSHAAPWTGEAKSFEYQWRRCETGALNCHPINGANASKYTLNGNDVGKVLELRETATNAAGSGVSVSAATATIVAGAALQSAAAGYQRGAGAGPRPARVPRRMEQRTDRFLLPVGALRRLRQQLRSDHRRQLT